MKKMISFLSAFLIVTGISLGTASADKSGVVKIPTHNWSSQLVGAEVVGELLKMVGEEIEYIPMDSQTVYQSMADGDIDLVHEIWEGAFGASYEKSLATGNVEEILTHDAVTREDWWYPNFVEETCPGLPSWEALNACSDQFARADSGGKGVFIGGPVDWLKHDAEKVEALGMNFEVRNAGSAGAIWAELDAGVAQNKPVVIFNWSPNFIGAKYPGKFVEFPTHDPKCTTDASWGVNPNALYDCGNPASGYLKLAVNKDFSKNHPAGYKVLKQMNFSGPDIDKMANYVDTDGLEVPAAAQKWLDEHESKWSNWVN
jgi:glycine betaine/proline transport system substrate-binding protein